jgi:TonB family protein
MRKSHATQIGPVATMFARNPVAAIALIGSVAVHASVLAGMPCAPQTARLQVASATDIDVTVASPDVPTLRADPNDGAAGRSVAASFARSPPREATLHGPVAADGREREREREHEREAEPATERAPSAPPSSSRSEARSPPLHFVIHVDPAMGRAPAAASAGGAGEQGAAVYGEDGVDARPRLLTWQAPRYPPRAASAGVEVDVPVDVVIDTEGLVTDVRLPRRFGYGLDEAAAVAARSYRFSRGLKGGRPVRVRMRCTVMFRLN